VILVDTSVWIEVFRSPSTLHLESLVDFDDIVTCLPVVQEVLQGFNSEPAYVRARESMLALPIVDSPIGQQRFVEAVDLYRMARRQGLTIRSGVDCLIAASAIRHQLDVLHRDRDFDALTRVSPLSARNVAAGSRRLPPKGGSHR
jgi:predicted nucleic acid-binding protein